MWKPDALGDDGPLAVNPIVVLAPAAKFDAQDGAFAVIVWPCCVTVAFQALPNCTPGGTVQLAVQFGIVAVPVLVSLTVAWNPPFHALSSWYAAEQLTGGGGLPPPPPTGGIK